MRWIVLLCLLPVLAHAQIYRWVDAQGRVHFSQHAQGANAEVIEVKPQVIERDAAAERRQRHAEQMQRCATLRSQLASMPEGRRYYQDDGKGERNYYSDKQLDAVRQQLRGRLSEQCG